MLIYTEYIYSYIPNFISLT